MHGEVVLSPDDVWLAILGSLTKYIDDYAEELRDLIVSHKDKKDLVVKYDIMDPRFSDIYSKEFRWDLIIGGFSKLIKSETKANISNIIECNFSTTKEIELIASQTALMCCC